MVSVTGAGERAIRTSPLPGEQPSFDFFLFVPRYLGSNSFPQVSKRLGTSVNFRKSQSENKVMHTSVSVETAWEKLRSTVSQMWKHANSPCHFPEHCCFPKAGTAGREKVLSFIK